MNNPITDGEELFDLLLETTNNATTSRGVLNQAIFDSATLYAAHMFHHCLKALPYQSTREFMLNLWLDSIRDAVEAAFKNDESNNTNS